jgi:hypothetical protein
MAHIAFPPGAEYHDHWSLTASTSNSPRPPSLVSSALRANGVGGCGLASHTTINTRSLSENSQSRTTLEPEPHYAGLIEQL